MSLPPRASIRKRISQTGLNSWLDDLAAARVLIAPRRLAGAVLYRRVSGSREIAWGFSRPVLSIKEVFFPPTESLMTIRKNGQELELTEILPDQEQVVFGVRPCEARGAGLLDALFLDTPPADPYYAHRREKTVLVGLACREIGPTCFCTSVGGAPDAAADVDVMLSAAETGYVLEVVTEKGAALVAGLSLPDYEDQFLPQTFDPEPAFTIPPLPSLLERFNGEYWERISERCLSCRACAYVCPTCRCFAVKDEPAGPGESERIRCWDSCAGANYRQVAGGHRPRPTQAERLRNRFYCKFYYFAEQTGLGNTSTCIGCGRCIDVCPAGVDITEILADLGGPA